MDQDLLFERGLQIVSRLVDNNYEAYIVGGAVRDALLKKPFVDIDICTNAKPDEILSLFPYAKNEYKEYGCITIKEEDTEYEITTFRIENYSSPRKPANLVYTSYLSEDVKRRDFTINALCYSKTRTLIDLVGGENDLNNKVIRAIGNPFLRFKEDPLRILRGIDLIARYNFHFERKTLRGLLFNRKLLATIGSFQFTSEMTDILKGEYSLNALKFINLFKLFRYDKYLTKWVKKLIHHHSLSLIEKYTLLYAMKGATDDNTCFKKENRDYMEQIIGNINFLKNQPLTRFDVYNRGKDNLIVADKLMKILSFKYKSQNRLIKKLNNDLTIHSRKDINYTPTDIINHTGGISGKYVGLIFNKIEERLIDGKIANTFEAIDQEVEILLPLYYKPHYAVSDLDEEENK